MINIDYSVLCHYPSIVSKDCLTLGILFHDKTNNKSDFKTIKKWERAKSFNDELDIEIVKLQLEAIKYEVESFIEEGDFDLEKYTKFYVNELRFTDVVKVEVEETFSDFISICTSQYMPLDLEKDKRPTLAEQTKFIKRMIKDSNIEYDSGKVIGIFNEEIKFDFKIGNYAFKIFKFENKEENRLLRDVKRWGYDCIKLKERYKIISVTDVDFSEDKYQIIYNILNTESEKIINFNELISFIQAIRCNSIE